MNNVIILAAGNGSRMKSALPKVCHKVHDKTMLQMVFLVAKEFSDKPIVVSSQDVFLMKDDFFPEIPDDGFIIQNPPLGTGDAGKVGIGHKWFDLSREKTIFLYGDTPFIKYDTIKSAIENTRQLSILSFVAADQSMKYGRIFLKNKESEINIGECLEISHLKEYKDFRSKESIPPLCSGGIIIGNTDLVVELIGKIDNKNNSGEYYLTDLINLVSKIGITPQAFIMKEEEILGINSQDELKSVREMYNED